MIRIFLQNRIWLIGFRVMFSFVQVVISQNGLKLLGSVEKWITLRDEGQEYPSSNEVSKSFFSSPILMLVSLCNVADFKLLRNDVNMKPHHGYNWWADWHTPNTPHHQPNLFNIPCDFSICTGGFITKDLKRFPHLNLTAAKLKKHWDFSWFA